MTRDEFIDGYMERSKIPASWRSGDGYVLEGHPGYVALPCACGEDGCNGWAMVRNEQFYIDTHNQFHAPSGDKSE